MGISPISPKAQIESRSSFSDSTVTQLSRFLYQIADRSPHSSLDFALFNEADYLPRKYALRLVPFPTGLIPALFFTSEQFKYKPESFSEADIAAFLTTLNCRLRISTECLLATAVYLDRAMDKGLELKARTWRPMLLACLVLSMKLWRDQPYLNSAVAVTCDLYSLRALNLMEIRMARYLEWELHINPEEYTRVSSRVAMA